MGKKGIYINTIIDKDTLIKYSGEVSKVKAQLKVMEENDLDTKLVNNIRIGIKGKILNRIPLCPVYDSSFREEILNLDLKRISFVYIRKYIMDFSFINLINSIKNANPSIIIILEIPTYPYESEWCNIKDFIFLLKERRCKRKLETCIDRIVTFSNDNEIYGIPTINSRNGIFVDNISKRKINYEEKKDINIIAVAGLSKWHGYDRMIKGMGEYYQKGGYRRIVFHVVGGEKTNPIRREYESIVKKYNIEENVVFYGNRKGKELDEIYNKSNFAIASLGMHRINLYLASTLKSREYAAKGLPMITSCKIDIFPDDYPYVMTIPANETPVNIDEMIMFYDNIYKNQEEYIKIAKKIRDFAKRNCDMQVVMRPIIECIQSDN